MTAILGLPVVVVTSFNLVSLPQLMQMLSDSDTLISRALQ